MKVSVKCSTCQELLGTIEKPSVTEIDVEFYRVMVVCSLGHGLENVTLEPEEEE
jgi:hypothetical protein